MVRRIYTIIPGLIVSFTVAVASKVIAVYIPTLGATTTSILLGLLLGNTICKMPILNIGTKIAESKLLEISVVLLGTTVTFQTVAHIGVKGLAYILLQMICTIIVAYKIGRLIKLSTNMSLLMAGGNAVCGTSAIASIAPVINAKEYEKGQIITIVNLLGTVMMFVLPIVASLLYKENIVAKSALIGGTLQSVGQVIASANMINYESVEWSMLFKIMRIMMLSLVVYYFGRFKEYKENKNHIEEEISEKRKIIIPWYVGGFIIFCIINSLFGIPRMIVDLASFLSGWFEVTALAAIGLRLDFRKFFKEGNKFLIYGVSVGFFQIILAIFLIYIFRI